MLCTYDEEDAQKSRWNACMASNVNFSLFFSLQYLHQGVFDCSVKVSFSLMNSRVVVWHLQPQSPCHPAGSWTFPGLFRSNFQGFVHAGDSSTGECKIFGPPCLVFYFFPSLLSPSHSSKDKGHINELFTSGDN